MEIPPDVIGLVSEAVARENTVIPIKVQDGSVHVAFHDPMALDVLDKLRFPAEPRREDRRRPQGADRRRDRPALRPRAGAGRAWTR